MATLQTTDFLSSIGVEITTKIGEEVRTNNRGCYGSSIDGSKALTEIELTVHLVNHGCKRLVGRQFRTFIDAITIMRVAIAANGEQPFQVVAQQNPLNRQYPLDVVVATSLRRIDVRRTMQNRRSMLLCRFLLD